MKRITFFISYIIISCTVNAQGPYKINPSTGGYLLDGSSQPIRDDKNWDVTNLKFIDEFTSDAASTGNWYDIYHYGRPKFTEDYSTTSPIYFNIDDHSDFNNSVECTAPYSVTNKKNHQFNQTSGITSCILGLRQEAFQGWYSIFDAASPPASSCSMGTWYKQESSLGWYKFTAGMLESKETFKYGWFEIRSRLKPHSFSSTYDYQGIGYNFWLWNQEDYSGGAGNYSEIDIYETDMLRSLMTSNMHLNTSTSQISNANAHHNEPDPSIDCQGKPYLHSRVVDMFTFHTYSLEWVNTNISTFYDDTRVGQYGDRNTSTHDAGKFIDMHIVAGFGTPYFCKSPMEQKIAGSWSIRDRAPQIINYEIDYIKVYKLICDNTVDVIQGANTTFNFSTYTYGIKKEIKLGGTNCVAKVSTGNNVSLRAKDGIELKAGFEVEAGAEFYANICDCTP